jgi:hypothetical protein
MPERLLGRLSLQWQWQRQWCQQEQWQCVYTIPALYWADVKFVRNTLSIVVRPEARVGFGGGNGGKLRSASGFVNSSKRLIFRGFSMMHIPNRLDFGSTAFL